MAERDPTRFSSNEKRALRLNSRNRATPAHGTRRAALASILALSTAAGAGAIVVGAEALSAPAAPPSSGSGAAPAEPDAEIIAFCAWLLPDVERLEAMSVEKDRLGERGWLPGQKKLFDASQGDAQVLAGMRPVTLPGFIAKARIARYHLFLGIQIARDLDALGDVSALSKQRG